MFSECGRGFFLMKIPLFYYAILKHRAPVLDDIAHRMANKKESLVTKVTQISL